MWAYIIQLMYQVFFKTNTQVWCFYQKQGVCKDSFVTPWNRLVRCRLEYFAIVRLWSSERLILELEKVQKSYGKYLFIKKKKTPWIFSRGYNDDTDKKLTNNEGIEWKYFFSYLLYMEKNVEKLCLIEESDSAFLIFFN